jgi:hypothetical protein
VTAPIRRLIVKLEPAGLSDEQMRQRVESILVDVPGAAVDRISRSGRVLLSCPEPLDLVQVAEQLSKRPDVAYAEPDVTDRAQPEE